MMMNKKSKVPTFTFKDAKKLGKSEKVTTDKKEAIKKCEAKLTQLLTRLGVNETEKTRYMTLCTVCRVSAKGQELSKASLFTLFGREDMSLSTTADDYHDEVTCGSSSGGQRNIFLRSFARPPFKKKANNDLGSKHIYFLTLLVGVGSASIAPSAKKVNTAFLCLPTIEDGTKIQDHDRLADLMIMKLYFVVRYIYKTLHQADEDRQQSTDKQSVLRLPIINVQRAAQKDSTPSLWYRLLKEKIFSSESPYARSLTADYFCNFL